MAITIDKFVANLRAIDPLQVLFDVIDKHKFFLSDANIEQWQQGKTGEGQPLTSKFTGRSTYSESWAKERQKKGLQVRFFDLRYTGELQDNLRTYIQKKKPKLIITIDASTPSTRIKQDELIKMFGDITGVPPKSLEEFAAIIDKAFTEELNRLMFKE